MFTPRLIMLVLFSKLVHFDCRVERLYLLASNNLDELVQEALPFNFDFTQKSLRNLLLLLMLYTATILTSFYMVHFFVLLPAMSVPQFP